MGGKRVFEDAWIDNSAVAALGSSFSPKRVSQTMYDFVSSRSCVAPSGSVPKQPACLGDADCDDGYMCNGVETCDIATGDCLPGTPHVCPSNGNACDGQEYCSYETNQCESTGVDPCSDGNVCNGLDTCTAQAGDVYQCSFGQPTCPEIVHATLNQSYW